MNVSGISHITLPYRRFGHRFSSLLCALDRWFVPPSGNSYIHLKVTSCPGFSLTRTSFISSTIMLLSRAARTTSTSFFPSKYAHTVFLFICLIFLPFRRYRLTSCNPASLCAILSLEQFFDRTVQRFGDQLGGVCAWNALARLVSLILPYCYPGFLRNFHLR